ncbi:MAG: H-NS histone family protein [Pseudomonadota bacterium]
MPESLAPLVRSKLKLRAAAKGLSSDDVARLITGLSSIQKTLLEKEADKAARSKRSKIAKIKAMMDEAGIDPSDLKGAKGKRGRAKSTKRAGRKVPPKYRLVVDGKEHLWTGRGRAPRVFQAHFDAGKSKDSCKIK